MSIHPWIQRLGLLAAGALSVAACTPPLRAPGQPKSSGSNPRTIVDFGGGWRGAYNNHHSLHTYANCPNATWVRAMQWTLKHAKGKQHSLGIHWDPGTQKYAVWEGEEHRWPACKDFRNDAASAEAQFRKWQHDRADQRMEEELTFMDESIAMRLGWAADEIWKILHQQVGLQGRTPNNSEGPGVYLLEDHDETSVLTCSGALIDMEAFQHPTGNPDFKLGEVVLTAGHCLDENHDLRIGVGHVRDEKALPVAITIPHPFYGNEEYEHDGAIEADLALLFVHGTFPPSTPRLKWPKEDEHLINQGLTFTGWGRPRDGSPSSHAVQGYTRYREHLALGGQDMTLTSDSGAAFADNSETVWAVLHGYHQYDRFWGLGEEVAANLTASRWLLSHALKRARGVTPTPGKTLHLGAPTHPEPPPLPGKAHELSHGEPYGLGSSTVRLTGTTVHLSPWKSVTCEDFSYGSQPRIQSRDIWIDPQQSYDPPTGTPAWQEGPFAKYKLLAQWVRPPTIMLNFGNSTSQSSMGQSMVTTASFAVVPSSVKVPQCPSRMPLCECEPPLLDDCPCKHPHFNSAVEKAITLIEQTIHPTAEQNAAPQYQKDIQELRDLLTSLRTSH